MDSNRETCTGTRVHVYRTSFLLYWAMSKRHTRTGSGQKNTIQRTTSVHDIMRYLPQAASLLQEYGLHCTECSLNTMETIESGCQRHGLTPKDADEILHKLNTLLRQTPQKCAALTIAKEAAQELRRIAEREQCKAQFLVTTDTTGNFCMEPVHKPVGMLQFSNPDVSDVSLFVSPLSLHHLGGGSVDFCNGTFALNLPPTSQKTHAECNNMCDCKPS